MKNSTRKNSMRKVSAALAMVMAMSAAVSTMAVTASAAEDEAAAAVVCDSTDHAKKDQSIPFTFQVNGRDSRVKDFHFRVYYRSRPLGHPYSVWALMDLHKLLSEKNTERGPEINGQLTCCGWIEVKATHNGTYEYTIPAWADPSTIEIRAGYNGLSASSNHNDMINYKFSNTNGVSSIKITTDSWTKSWGGYGTSMELMVNDTTILRGVD